jgi:hypothetical protein
MIIETHHWYTFERYWDKLSGCTIIFDILISLFDISQNTFSQGLTY